MTDDYQDMTTEERVVFWSDVAVGRMRSCDPFIKLCSVLRGLAQECYEAGLEDGRKHADLRLDELPRRQPHITTMREEVSDE